MLRTKVLIMTVILAGGHLSVWADNSEAGCLLDWLRGHHSRRAAVAPAYASVGGLQPGQCATTCQQTCSRVVVNYVPCTSYRTCWNRVPVTQYRPVTNSDPCTGCTVTCMRPCTTYSWQMQRVPYTTYRPVYRTETYQVPVTTITNDCNQCDTCAPAAVGSYYQPSTGCSTCAAVPTTSASPVIVDPSTSAIMQGTNSSYMTVPQQTLSTDGYYNSVPLGTGLPADTTPFLDVNPQNTQRPVIERIITEPDNSSYRRLNNPYYPAGGQNLGPEAAMPSNDNWNQAAPALINSRDKTARRPIHRQWKYSPVRLASYTSIERSQSSHGPIEIQGRFEPQNSQPSAIDAGWETVKW